MMVLQTIEGSDLMAIVIVTALLVILSLASLRYGAESRPGFSGPVDWRRLDA